MIPEISLQDYPAMFISADAGSASTKGLFYKLVAVDVSLLLLGAIVAVIPVAAEKQAVFNAVSALILFASIMVALVLKQKNFEAKWYEARAVSESVKTVTWQYMMCATPFDGSLAGRAADKLFLEKIDEVIRGRARNVLTLAGASDGNDEQITPKMRNIRSSRLNRRKEIYCNERIADQRRWYSQASKKNKNKGSAWYWVTTLAQAAGCGIAIVCAITPAPVGGWVAFWSAVTASSLSWIQLNRFQELAESYAVAANDLSLVAAQSDHIHTDVDFSRFVRDAENAVSREHTLWTARRDLA